MDFEYFLLVAFLFKTVNVLVIMFFQRARDNDTFLSYLVVFCYALFIVVFHVILVWMLVDAKTV